MASHLSVFMGTPVGTVKRDFASNSDESVVASGDAFGKLLERDQPNTPDAAAPAKDTAPKDATAPSQSSNDAPADDKSEAQGAGEAAATDAVPEENAGAEDTGPVIPEDLLAAFASLAEGKVTSLDDLKLDPEKLAALKKKLEELADVLGMDMSAMLQQLQQLAQPVAEGAVGDQLGFAAELTQWLGDKLQSADPAKAQEIDVAFAKVLDAAKVLTAPAEPKLATPDLKLDEPVLTGKANADKPVPEEAKAAKVEPRVERPTLDHASAAQNDKPKAAAKPSDDTALANAIQQQGSQPDSAQPVRTDVTQAAPRVVQAGYQTSQQQLNMPQLAFELARQAQDGNTRFQIRLDPPEMGRIDVKLDIDKGGQVTARLTVEKSETLDLMQRDRTALERALQQSGLDASKTNLEFSLKQNPFANDGGNLFGDRNGSGRGQGGGGDAAEDEPAAPTITLYRGNVSASGVNIIA